jgi:hypothetical protein
MISAKFTQAGKQVEEDCLELITSIYILRFTHNHKGFFFPRQYVSIAKRTLSFNTGQSLCVNSCDCQVKNIGWYVRQPVTSLSLLHGQFRVLLQNLQSRIPRIRRFRWSRQEGTQSQPMAFQACNKR